MPAARRFAEPEAEILEPEEEIRLHDFGGNEFPSYRKAFFSWQAPIMPSANPEYADIYIALACVRIHRHH